MNSNIAVKRTSNHVDGGAVQKKSKPDNHDPLDTVLGEMNSYQHGKTNHHQQSKSHSFSTENLLNRILDMTKVDSSNVDNLEVEGRIGLFRATEGGNFKPGMIKEDFDTLLATLSQKRSPKFLKETDYIFSDYRITYDEENKRCLRKESKTDRTTFDQSTNLVYDMRVSLSIEDSMPPPTHLPLDYSMKRDKSRFTFHERDWKVDLTHVVVYPKGGLPEELFEVEIELYTSSIKQNTDKQSLTNLLNEFIQYVRFLITSIQKGGLSFADISLEKVENVQEIYELRERLYSYLPKTEKKREMFPGAMPVNFSKKNFLEVQSNRYFASEKTDGIRYMILITNNRSFLIDRHFDFYSIKDYDVLHTLFGRGTLIDGEMVRNLNTHKPVYLIFDVLAVNNEAFYHVNLSQRLGVIGQIISQLRQEIEHISTPFEILGKVFHPKEKIHEVFNCIKDRGNGERTFIDKRRNHFTDGVILTPDVPYQTFTNSNLFKWKYLDKWTIDFKINFRQNRFFLSCTGTQNTEIDCREANFSPEDMEKLRIELKRARDPTIVIAECSFQPKIGKWKFHQTRPDKKKGNFITIVMDTMESIAENLSHEELKYRIPLKPENDNWDDEMSRLKSSMFSSMKPTQSYH
ncbi:hypothetical protein CYY_004924 [Polysphondylium violaceum]|uniref:mRNA guanylyltransferase n=1 Tax=Polysphondylium violaceum TaxID=133409 RepID=A0A8J4UYY1_9MYCE|nr:hypothetical protein CYY_004924 [Polysphondylium violaceum]